MEMKQLICMEVKKNDNVYRLIVPAGAGYGELYDALFEMLNSTIKLAQDAASQAAPAVQQDNACKQEEVIPEVM